MVGNVGVMTLLLCPGLGLGRGCDHVAMMDRPATLRVASFNVCGLPSRLAPLAERAAEFGRQIDESDIDVVNLQEIWGPRTFALVRSRLPSYPFVAWRWGLAGRPAGGLVTFSRHPLGPVAYTSFRGVVPRSGGAGFRLLGAVNSMLQGILMVELPGLGAVVANAHLTANRDGAWSATNRYHTLQRAQVRALQATLRPARGQADLILVTGDFNIPSDSVLYSEIIDGWRDPFPVAEPTTYHVEFLPPGARGRRIDYILVAGDESRFPVLDAQPLFAEPVTMPDGRRLYLSDHVALTVRIALPVR
jgi:exonuclease III